MAAASERTGSTIDPAEVARFDAIARDWWDPKGPMAVLHKFNPVRLAFVRDEVCAHFGRDAKQMRALSGLSLVDIGCGGGVLSEPLARLGSRPRWRRSSASRPRPPSCSSSGASRSGCRSTPR